MENSEAKRIDLLKTAALLLIMTISVCFSSCGGSPAQDESDAEPAEEIVEENAVPDEEEAADPWDYFAEVSCLGQTYDSIISEHTLIEGGNADGGVFFTEDGTHTSYGFPALTADDMTGSEICTAMYGTLGDFLDIDREMDLEEINELLSVDLEPFEGESGVLYSTKLYHGTAYNIALYIGEEGTSIGPDTGVRIGLDQ